MSRIALLYRHRPLLAVLAALAALAGAARAEESFAHVVPAEVGLFVELRDADDLLVPLAQPQAWLTVAELAGQPARVEETAAWRQRVERIVHMTPEDAIRILFSEQVAYAGEEWRGGGGGGVVLCRPVDDPRALVRRWGARPLPTARRSMTYELPANLTVGVQGDRMVIGDASSHDTFPRILELLDRPGGTSLADSPAYRQLLERVPPDPAGVVYARIAPYAATTSPASRPSAPARAELPALLRDSSHVLLALHRDGPRLHFTAVGDTAPATAPAPGGALTDLVATLPERTLLAYGTHVDFPALGALIEQLPERNVLRVAYEVQRRMEKIEPLVDTLGSATCVAVGVVTPASRTVAAPPLPAVALLVETLDAETAQRRWSELVESGLLVYKLLEVRFGAPPTELATRAVTVADRRVQQVDFSSALAADPAQHPLAELHLSWTLDDDVLIIASHTDWLRQILAARHGAEPRLAPVLALTGQAPSQRHDSIFVAQTGPIADLGTLWEQWFQQHAPRVLTQRFWRRYQPGGVNPRLGIQVHQDAERQRLIVRTVTPGLPADGILRPGDEIVGVFPRRFATSQPVREITAGLRTRPNARWIDLFVERDRFARGVRIPLSFVDPVEIARRIIAAGQLVQRVVYHDDVPDERGPRGYLTFELRQQPQPLFAFDTAKRTPETAETTD